MLKQPEAIFLPFRWSFARRRVKFTVLSNAPSCPSSVLEIARYVYVLQPLKFEQSPLA